MAQRAIDGSLFAASRLQWRDLRGGRAMKTKKLVLLGAAVLTVVCSLGLPANAATFDWNVSFQFSGTDNITNNAATVTVTGTIVSDCDSCWKRKRAALCPRGYITLVIVPGMFCSRA